MLAEAIRTEIGEHTAGAVAESRLFVEDWPTDFAAVTVPVEIYHGAADENAPLSGVRELAEVLPDATSRVLPEKDHLGTLRATRRTALS